MSRPLELVIPAEVASEGLAHGVIHPLGARRAGAATRPAGTPEQERAALQQAVAAAAAELAELAGQADAMGAEIVAFQIAMLADPELIAPALEAVAGGEPAETAFRDGIDLQIADYNTAGDEYFQARADDLADLRDRVLKHLCGELDVVSQEPPEGAIVVAEELTPSRFLETDWRRCRGAALTSGSAKSHVAMLARARGVPLLIKLEAALGELAAGADAVLDGEQGRLIVRPSEATGHDYDRRIAAQARARAERESNLAEPARTADGTAVAVHLNVDDPALLEAVDPAHCDGIGLARSEFLFRAGGELPDEERQYRVYRALLHWAGGLPVTIRTLDAGGDKPVPGLTLEGEANPFLGLRGLRLSLARPEVFKVQLRALARAAHHGPLKVMVPMVTVPDELEQARALLAGEVEALRAKGVDAAVPAFGMMVETPAAALTVADFKADFLSLGTNDLMQYVMAASRDDGALAALQDPLNPAILELIERVAAHGRNAGVEVSVCGEMAALPATIPALLAAGVRVLSAPPAALAAVKAAVRACRLEDHG
jgi:phosphotransferase system enzyme I (PtsI)